MRRVHKLAKVDGAIHLVGAATGVHNLVEEHIAQLLKPSAAQLADGIYLAGLIGPVDVWIEVKLFAGGRHVLDVAVFGFQGQESHASQVDLTAPDGDVLECLLAPVSSEVKYAAFSKIA